MSKQFPPRTGSIDDPNNLESWLDKIAQYFNQEPQVWTPTLSFATPGDLSVVYSRQLGYIWAMGNMVKAIGSIITTTFTYTTAAGNNQILGLPYAGKTATGLVQVGECLADGWTKANYTQAAFTLSSGAFTANLRLSGSGQPLYIPTVTDMPSGTQQTRHFSITYFRD